MLTIFRAVLSKKDVDALRAAPSWEARLALSTMTAREARVEDAYTLDPERLSRVACPTLLLVGAQSPPEMRATAEIINAALSDCRIEALPSQQHVAHLVAPELPADRIV